MSNAMTEFKITTDLSALRQQVIEANFDEVREWLDKNLAPYRDLAVSSDDLSTAKSYRASIRKVRDRIDQSRKEAKAAALAAYSDFETKCKELTGLCDDAANAIDIQVKAFEDAEKREKLAAIRADYDEHITEEMEIYCPWERVFNPKWENKGYSIELAQEEIYEAIMGTANDLEAIREMGGNDTPYLLDVYKQTHSMTAVVRKASELQTMREREEKRKAEDAEFQKARANAIKQRSVPTGINVHDMMDATSGAGVPSSQQEEEFVTVDFRVTCTKQQLTLLGQYMKQNGIAYGRCG